MIAIVDCNNFYCSCERVFDPSLRTRPIIVLSNNDGCIISRSDEARELGLPMAGPVYMARNIIHRHKVAVFSSNYNLYGDISRRVMDTLKLLAGDANVEVYSVDESFLHLQGYSPSQLFTLAHEIRQTIEAWTGIPVSVGIAPTKVLAKAANRIAKKNKPLYRGVMVLNDEQAIERALQQTPVKDIWGIGKRYAEKLETQFQVSNAFQLQQMNEAWANTHLGGVVGARLWKELNGFSCIELKAPLVKKKMIACTRMFGSPVSSLAEIREAVASYAARAAEKLRRQQSAAAAIEVYLVKNDYEEIYTYNPATDTRHMILPQPTASTQDLINHALPLAEQMYRKGSRYLKAGVILSQLVPDTGIQGNLFSPEANPSAKLMATIDNINWGMKKDSLRFGAAGLEQRWQMKQDFRSPRYTTRWDELKKVG